jgi:hypothetical protein
MLEQQKVVAINCMHSPEVKGRVRFVVLLLYAALVVWLTLHHEPWRDEADVWLMGRDNSIVELFRRVGYSGSPMLWHLLISVLAKTSMPYISMGLLNSALGIATAALILLAAPFGLAVNTLLIFSYLFSYEYPVVARSYQLSVFLILLLAAFHRQRQTNPIKYSVTIALLANTNVHGFIIALTIWVTNAVSLFLRKADPKLLLQALLPAVLGIALSMVQLNPPLDGQFKPNFIDYHPDELVLSFREAFAPALSNIDHSCKPFSGKYDSSRFALSLIAISSVGLLIRKSRFAQISLLGSWAGLIALFVFKYSGGVRHWGFLLVMAVYACWVSRLEYASAKPSTNSSVATQPTNTSSSTSPAAPFTGRRTIQLLSLAERCASIAIVMVFFFSVAVATQAWRLETRSAFSDSKRVAEFLVQNQMDRLPIAGFRDGLVKPILPYLNCKSLFYPTQKRHGSFFLWDSNTYVKIGERELISRLNEQFGRAPQIVLITAPGPLRCAKQNGFRQVYATNCDTITNDEKYFVYLRDRTTSSADRKAVAQDHDSEVLR